MNRELAEVRRYWPRAKYDPSCLYQYSAAGGLIWLMILGGEAEIARAVGQQWIRCRGDTIAEAMRAAGFGPRPLGKHARERVKRSEYRKQLMGYAALGPSWAAGAARLLAYCQPQLADRKRPRKGARLGKRKRQSDATPEASPKWYAVATTYPRYELRHGAEVLTVVTYSRSDGMWTAPRTGGFRTKEFSMRWEEMRLRMPTCPVMEVQP